MTLTAALARLDAADPAKMDFGLERISIVLEQMALAEPAAKVVTVAGTNGKGSTCKLIHDIFQQAGYRCGLYSSPHLVTVNERLVINDQVVCDDALANALDAVEEGRGEVQLSYFEQLTVAALWWFQQSAVDVMVLEVGLGGRLDAVNAVDADVAVVTNISLDHADWLGTDLAQIGREKAAVARAHKPLLLGSQALPESVADYGAEIKAEVLLLGRDFHHLPEHCLPVALHKDNAATAVAVGKVLTGFEVSEANITAALSRWAMPGRCQEVRDGEKNVLLDVAHNRASAMQLAAFLRKNTDISKTVAVFGIYADKEVDDVISAVSGLFERWHVAPLEGARSLDGKGLAAALDNQDNVSLYASITEAYSAAKEQATADELIVAFGSFEVVGPVLELIQR